MNITFAEFKGEQYITERALIEIFLLAALEVKPLTLITLPGELPDGAKLGRQMDMKFKQEVARIASGNLFTKLVYAIKTAGSDDVTYKKKVLSELFDEIVRESQSFTAHIHWADKLGLHHTEYTVRPSIREVYFYKDNVIKDRLLELFEMREAIKAEAWKNATAATPYQELVYPEEKSTEYQKAYGYLLGYPRCCTLAYLEDRANEINVEVRAARQLSEQLEAEPEFEPWAYFVKDFFPCSPDCKKAWAKGKKAHQLLSQIEKPFGETYLNLLRENMLRTLDYPELLNTHREKLEKDEL